MQSGYYDDFMGEDEDSMDEPEPEYETFIFYGSFRKSVDCLPPEKKGKLLWDIMEYGTTGTYTESDPDLRAVMCAIIPVIDKAKARYDSRLKRQREKAAGETTKWEKAAREKAAREKAAQEKAAQEKAAREKAAREKAAQEKVAQEKATWENSSRPYYAH